MIASVVGTTVLVALLRGSQLVVANVGDSRGVLCDKDGRVRPISFDHKPQQVSPVLPKVCSMKPKGSARNCKGSAEIFVIFKINRVLKLILLIK